MNKAKVYLAGPITGCNWGESEDWRDEFKRLTAETNIAGYSPMRGKEYLKKEAEISDSYQNMKMSTQRAIMARDFWDVTTSDAILVNFTEAKRVSIGTVMECAWAWQLKKPLIVIMEPGNLHEHSMLREATDWHVQTLDEAIAILLTLFNP